MGLISNTKFLLTYGDQFDNVIFLTKVDEMGVLWTYFLFCSTQIYQVGLHSQGYISSKHPTVQSTCIYHIMYSGGHVIVFIFIQFSTNFGQMIG